LIIIFCDFCQFSAEKFGVLLKKQCYDKIFAKTSISARKKRQFFGQKNGENILSIITSVSGWSRLAPG
jgi:hypothetical protein